MVGVQQVAGIDLERERGPEEERAVRAGVGDREVDRIAHPLNVLALRDVAQDVSPLRSPDVVALGPDDAGCEGLVVERAVVALGVVLDRDLPVAPLGHFDPFERLQRADVGHVRRQFLAHTGIPRVHRRRVIVQVDEDEAVEGLGTHRREPDGGRIEAGNRRDVEPAAEGAVELVGPGVIGADDGAHPASALQERMGAVLADVVEAAQDPVAAANAEQALARDLDGKIVARVADEALVPGKLPGAGEKTRALPLEDGRIGVVARRQRMDGRSRVPHGHALASVVMRPD